MKEKILKDLSVNIVKWYTFKKSSDILYVGNNEEITKFLRKKYNVDTVVTSSKYDYILIDKEFISEDEIAKLKEKIKEDGTLILILDNKFGISNFLTYNYDEQNSSLEETKKYTNINKIINYLEKENFYINKYMVYPNKTKVDMIINDQYDQISDKIEKYFYSYEDNKIVICDEIKTLKQIEEYDNELLKKLANTYFIEATLEPNANTIKYVSFNNYRKDKYRLITKIEKDRVSKIEENDEAKEHKKNIIKGLEELKKYNFKILDKYENGVLYSDFIEGKQTLDVQLAENSDNLDYVVDIILKIKQELMNHCVKYSDFDKNPLYKNENHEMLKELKYLEYAFYDMVPKNCFYINNEFNFFDQEWMAKYLPVEFIIYRSIINSYDLVRKINIDELLNKLEIQKYRELFDKIDKKIREEIIDVERLNICQKQYKKMYEVVYENKNLSNQIKNYQENDKKQNEYIKALENEIERLKQIKEE